MKTFVIACASLFAFATSACSSWAATPVDVCKGPVDYVEIAEASGSRPTDPIQPDGGTDDLGTWSREALNLKTNQTKVLCYPDGGINFKTENLPANVKACKVVPATGGKKTMLCE